jgi:accessory gene regulator B
MNHKLSVLICQKLAKHGIISKDIEEVYIYGFELILSFLISVSIILTIGIFISKIVETIAFLVLFILIRQLTGGFHANTYAKCQIYTVSFYLCVILLSSRLTPTTILYALTLVVSALVIIMIGPIESSHKPLTGNQKKKNKLWGLGVFLVTGVSGMLVYKIAPTIYNTIFYSLLLIIILMIIPYTERRIKNVRCNRKNVC